MAAECLDFDPASLGPKEARRLDRSTQFALTAAREAWDDSGIEGGVDKDETGVVFATGIGGISSLLASDAVMREKGPNRVSPFTVPQLMPNAAAGQIAMKLGLRGPTSPPPPPARPPTTPSAWPSRPSGTARPRP